MSYVDYGMANLDPLDTGLGTIVIMISPKTRNHYIARVKVSNIPNRASRMEDAFTVILTGEKLSDLVINGKVKLSGPDKNKVLEYIQNNRHAILAFWNGEIETTRQFYALAIESR